MTELSQPIETILRAIRDEREFRKSFSEVADTIVDKVYSYYTNPNCTCKASVIDWINANPDVTNSVIQKHASIISAMTEDISKATKLAEVAQAPTPRPGNTLPSRPPMMNNPKAKFGEIVDIERDPEAYMAFIKNAMTEGWVYRGISVVPDIVDGKAVWSLFFY